MEQTVKGLIEWSSERLAKKGIDTPRLDSEVLLAFVLNIERGKLFLYFQKKLIPSEFQQFKALHERRERREPLSYITESKEFWSLQFKVNRHVLVPRPETEILIEKTLKIIEKDFAGHDNIFVNDIGTGSGNIAISLAREKENLFAVATDNSKEVLSIAGKNAILNQCEKEVSFQKRDLFGELNISSGKNKFDIILSNPPYIPTEEIETLAPEIKDYEPRAALDGGPDGLDFYRKIIAQVLHYLKKGGYVAFEMGYDQGETISELLNIQDCFSEIEITKDYSGKERVISARLL